MERPLYHYKPLKDFLAERGDRSICLSFEDIERLIGRPLPASAKGGMSRQWWSNAASHSQAKAWLSLGRKAKLDLGNSMVTFSRPAPVTTLPGIIQIDVSDLHPNTIQFLENVVAEHKIAAEVAAAALLNSAANDRSPVGS